MTPLGAAPADLAAVTAIVRAAGTSFSRGMRVLPADRRAAMHAIYAFCRIVDDIADADAEPAAKIVPLNDWRTRIEALYDGQADDPVTRILLRAINRFALRKTDFHAVIDGMGMDAGAPIVAPDLATLTLYVDRVAVAVGRLSVRAFGDSSPAADDVAAALGTALQYTNILRDLHEDARRGRLYLPSEWLRDAAIPLTPEAALASPALPVLCARMAAAAHAAFAAARASMTRCDRRAMRPARLMAASYDAVLAALERRGWSRLTERPRVPAWRKLLILFTA